MRYSWVCLCVRKERNFKFTVFLPKGSMENMLMFPTYIDEILYEPCLAETTEIEEISN